VLLTVCWVATCAVFQALSDSCATRGIDLVTTVGVAVCLLSLVLAFVPMYVVFVGVAAFSAGAVAVHRLQTAAVVA
jgi:hypothetical protein